MERTYYKKEDLDLSKEIKLHISNNYDHYYYNGEIDGMFIEISEDEAYEIEKAMKGRN